MKSFSFGTATRQGIAVSRGARPARRDLHPPRIADLLQRQESPITLQETRKIIGGKTVLVTGAGGSIGGEVCRQVAAAGPRKLLLVDKSENGLFYANLEATETLGASQVKPFLVDVVDRRSIRKIVRNERPDIVFHAAAHKHVAMLEMHPAEAIRNNVLGTRNIAEAALEWQVNRFVNISTDKAVQPQSYMGLSKKIAELCVQEMALEAAPIGETRFSTARFGNVAGTTGSVIRLFWEQILKGGPVRVTDPRAVRYFMSASEAVHLILRAASLGRGGETFVFEMGEPLNIYELATNMILSTGLKPGSDIPIEFVGLRDGEKLNEALWEDWELPRPVVGAPIRMIHAEGICTRHVLSRIRRIEEFFEQDDEAAVLRCAREIFPEFAERCSTMLRPAPLPEIASLAAMGAA